jgi:hypothetical protein
MVRVTAVDVLPIGIKGVMTSMVLVLMMMAWCTIVDIAGNACNTRPCAGETLRQMSISTSITTTTTTTTTAATAAPNPWLLLVAMETITYESIAIMTLDTTHARTIATTTAAVLVELLCVDIGVVIIKCVAVAMAQEASPLTYSISLFVPNLVEGGSEGEGGRKVSG